MSRLAQRYLTVLWGPFEDYLDQLDQEMKIRIVSRGEGAVVTNGFIFL